MIKVIEEKEVPRAQVECINFHSLLEYGNADLSGDYEAVRETIWKPYACYRDYYFICPVCGCKNSASWITKKQEGV